MKVIYWMFVTAGLLFTAAGIYDGAAASFVGAIMVRLGPAKV